MVRHKLGHESGCSILSPVHYQLPKSVNSPSEITPAQDVEQMPAFGPPEIAQASFGFYPVEPFLVPCCDMASQAVTAFCYCPFRRHWHTNSVGLLNYAIA